MICDYCQNLQKTKIDKGEKVSEMLFCSAMRKSISEEIKKCGLFKPQAIFFCKANGQRRYIKACMDIRRKSKIENCFLAYLPCRVCKQYHSIKLMNNRIKEILSEQEKEEKEEPEQYKLPRRKKKIEKEQYKLPRRNRQLKGKK